jgi:hypothetical protein
MPLGLPYVAKGYCNQSGRERGAIEFQRRAGDAVWSVQARLADCNGIHYNVIQEVIHANDPPFPSFYYLDAA